MAIYHFSGQMMSRISKQTGKPKSPLACAAYRSGDKLIDEVDNQSFFYKREINPVTNILAPDHAPDWVYDRQKLWNEVNKIEKNYNAQFAREFNVALPVELSNEQQENLALEFCQEAFVDRGMVADVAIHRDDKNNPHFHVMLTVRPFNKDGSWGIKAKREYVFDDKGNHVLDKKGKKKFIKVNTTDWNKREVFNEWRKKWAEKANQFLHLNDINTSISHLSNEDLGIEKMPTIHEGYVARKMEKNGFESDRISHNKQVKKYNHTVEELNKYKDKKKQINYQNKFARKFSPMEKKALRDIAKELKMFVSFDTITERTKQLDKWRKSIQFRQENEQKLKQLDRIVKEEHLLEKANDILNGESERFIRSNYPTWNINALSLEERVAIVDKTINNNRLLKEHELDEIGEEVYSNNLLKEINSLLQNRYAFVLTVDVYLLQLNKTRINIEKKVNIKSNSDEDDLKQAALKHPKEIKQLKEVVEKTKDLFKAKDLMNEFYDLEINKLYPSIDVEKLTLEEKEILVVGTEYYEQEITIDAIPTLQRYSTEDQIKLINLLIDNQKETINQLYPTFQVDNPRYLMFFKDECLRNLKELSIESRKLLKTVDPQMFATTEMDNSDLVKDMDETMNVEIDNYSENHALSHVSSGVTRGFLRGIFEDRSYTSKKQFEEDLKSKSKRKYKTKNIHRSGPSL
ncbi:MobQ family relaxase [Paraliobacillus ryukyuensis]|uniref:MobQ family relaxase n=1 Tax=Paraliobacillus ryukyuensis TaxID=200904 RepID=UPI0015C4C899|nr:MobQ family relaxase [Paraliobacillus ryukyuensis]